MAKFYITNESTEDTFGATDDLHQAICLAKEVAKNGQAGDLVLVESDGKGIKQFVLTSDGTVVENEIS